MTNEERMIMFTSENPNNMTKKLNLKDKDVLTITNSGDQALNFILAGAKSIKLFDNNPNSKYIFYLKKALIENLSYQEFLNFFVPGLFNKNEYFSKEKYDLIKDDISIKEVREYWDDIFNNHTSRYINNIFVNRIYNRKELTKRNNYLASEKNYNKLKERLKEIKEIEFEEIDILHQIIYVKDKVDFIYLSDILNYIPSKSKDEYLKKLKTITLNISNNLKENGIISVSYMHCYLDEYLNALNNIQNLVTNREDFLTNECETIGFRGGYNPNSNVAKDRDAVILYKNKKKIREKKNEE
ncbi:MAG: DUF3419 family protein [Bacilli bacterium]|nr:DUF3419 family protein [Bacilli bacterium]